MLVYPAGLDLSTRHVTVLADALRGHRARIGSRWRKLEPGRQALLVLAHLRKNETYTALAAGFALSVATVFRYVREALTVLAAMAPSLQQALHVAARKAYVVLDGTVIRIDRVRTGIRGADAAFYCGKVGHHGMNVQVIAGPRGELIWTSPALPGARHDSAAAREHELPTALATVVNAGGLVLADRGYQGAGPSIRVPFRSRRKDPDTGRYLPLSDNQKACNSSHAKLRAPGERANAQLKSWKILTRVRTSPERTTDIVHAITALIQQAYQPG